MNEPGLDATVLIPSYNSKNTLIPCLEQLTRQTWPADRFEVIVVLDGSTDGSKEALGKLSTPFPLKLIEQPNQGRAAALNRGARDAAGGIIIIIDSDILTNATFVENHLAAHQQADVVIGPIPLSDKTPVNFLTDRVREWADEHTKKMLDNPEELTSTSLFGGNISMPRSLYEQLGGYREELRRTEDFHMGEKILRAGLRVAFCPEAVAAQIFDKTFYAWCRDIYVDGRSHLQLIREFPELKKKLRAGRFYPATMTKKIIRPMIIHRQPLGNLVLATSQAVLETARRMGLRWEILSAIQGVIGDSLYFRGVYDALGSQERFNAFIQPD
ncbi:MAG: glycosyltransferase [Desulfobacterales bacterium]|nr:glycosyltransferase [Desulfobacterales bacterium]